MLWGMLQKNGKSFYEQIYEMVKADILNGSLPEGGRLPSKRKLADRLKVSVITVENAYQQLEAEGYLYAKERSGYFVARIERVSPRQNRPETPVIKTEETHYLMDFQSRSVRTQQFPFTVWAKIMRSVISRQESRLFQPVQYNGVSALRRAIALYLLNNRGIAADPEQIIIGAGTEYLEHLVVQLLGRNRVYAVEDPGYPKTAKIYERNGVVCRPIPFTKGKVPLFALEEQGVEVLHLSPSHHFPTGTVLPISQRQELLRWAGEDANRYIVEDDYDSEFRFVGRPIEALFSIDQNGKVIYMNTFSMTIAPSMRISYLILPWALLETFRRTLGFYACTVPSLEQYTLAEFIAEGHFERHISRMKKRYRQKRDTVIEAILQSPLAARAAICEEDAGLHFLLRLDTAVSDAEIKRRALAMGIRLCFLSDYQFRPNPRNAHLLVIGYAGIDTEPLAEVFARLAEILS